MLCPYVLTLAVSKAPPAGTNWITSGAHGKVKGTVLAAPIVAGADTPLIEVTVFPYNAAKTSIRELVPNAPLFMAVRKQAPARDANRLAFTPFASWAVVDDPAAMRSFRSPGAKDIYLGFVMTSLLPHTSQNTVPPVAVAAFCM